LPTCPHWIARSGRRRSTRAFDGGELRALRWPDVDFGAGLIRVERSWDPVIGPVEPKSRSGRRRVPLGTLLRHELVAHRLRSGTGEDGFVFPSRTGLPFDPGRLLHALALPGKEARLDSIGLHDCRHTYAAFMIAAGVNAKALSSYMGHVSITITLDRYGHLMPGDEREAAGITVVAVAAALVTWIVSERVHERVSLAVVFVVLAPTGYPPFLYLEGRFRLSGLVGLLVAAALIRWLAIGDGFAVRFVQVRKRAFFLQSLERAGFLPGGSRRLVCRHGGRRRLRAHPPVRGGFG
jgi:hypothetical protein